MARISFSVGRGGRNHPEDVAMVQRLLNWHEMPGDPPPLEVDGLAGPRTMERIEHFQRTILGYSRPDGRVDPGAATIAALAEAGMLEHRREPWRLAPSGKAIDLLKAMEGLRLTPYDDQTGERIDRWVQGATVGYGHLIARDEWHRYRDGISEARAEALLREDLAPYAEVVRTHVRVPLRQQEFDALVILVFNIGAHAFASSSVLDLINDPEADTAYDTLESAWKAWNRSQGRVMAGLVKRRESEWNIFENGRYEGW